MAKVAIIGAGFSGLSAAAYLARDGHTVDVFEKNEQAGGRARKLETNNGYVFDMGPSWYWMPDIFENFFSDFGTSVADHYELKLLDPGFDIVFREGRFSVPSDYTELSSLFESVENNASKNLQAFMKQAQFKYEAAMKKMIMMPGLSVWEFADPSLIGPALKLDLFSPFDKHIRKYFSDQRLLALMEFPVLFLGAMPGKIPALYSLMNYAGLKLGTWYPMGGFAKVVEAMKAIAEKEGARFYFGEPVKGIVVNNHRANGVITGNGTIDYDLVVASADYQHVENELLPEGERNYNEVYWEKRTLAPSCLIFYIGIDKKLPSLQHHTLFFDEDLSAHAADIYQHQCWPRKPLFYVSCTSTTDPSTAPAGHENLFLLMPIANALPDDEAIREKYLDIMLSRLEKYTNEKELRTHIDYIKSYCVSDFVQDYNSYKGNAYGLANTLRQTAILKPKMRNRKVSNLFYTGQLTVPGPGVPACIISGKIVAQQANKYLTRIKYETTIR